MNSYDYKMLQKCMSDNGTSEVAKRKGMKTPGSMEGWEEAFRYMKSLLHGYYNSYKDKEDI